MNKNSQRVIKIEKGTDITYIHRANGVIDLVVNGGINCKHLFAAYGKGYDGNYYYHCITGGGCTYKKKLSSEKVDALKVQGLLE